MIRLKIMAYELGLMGLLDTASCCFDSDLPDKVTCSAQAQHWPRAMYDSGRMHPRECCLLVG